MKEPGAFLPAPEAKSGVRRKFLQVALAGFTLLLPMVAPAATAGLVPSFETVRAAHQPSDGQFTDRHGVPLQNLRLDATVRRLDWLRLDQVSPALQAALLAAEDKRFYEHGGVDWAAVGQAAWDNLKARVSAPAKGAVKRGASTLSMQLAALLDPALKPVAKQRRDLGQKWDQAQAAWEIEKHWSKAQIFEAYLNLLPLRGETVGIAAASEVWFGKTADGLDLAEAALLAALVRQPQATPSRVGERACGIVTALDAGVLPLLPRPDCAELKGRASASLAKPLTSRLAASLAPHAARQALAEWRNDKHGSGGGVGNFQPRNVARRVFPSTLDARLQNFVRERLDQQLRELAGRNVEDGAALVLDNASGEVLAWVGSSGVLSDAADVDGVTALRQAGSTLKPFLYGLAIDQRLFTAASLIDDSPVALTAENGVYIPQNYDHHFRGMVSVRTALAASLNIPAVRTLLLTGTDRFYEQLKRFGFLSLGESADYYGLALALGSAEIRLIDLANAYRALANGGIWSPVAPLLKSGMPTKQKLSRRVMGAGAAWIIGDILSDRGARAPTFGLENALATRLWSAVKTGTSKDMRDNWAVGYTNRYTVAVWVGNFSGASMWNVSGVHGAAPLWRDIVHFLHETAPGRAPFPPSGVTAVQVRFDDIEEATRREWFLTGTAMPVVARAMAVEDSASDTPSRIVYPADGLIVALDPDIPPDMARLPLRMQPERRGLIWRLERSGTPPCVVLPETANWAPEPGNWRALLLDSAGQTVDSVRFLVRGAAPSAPSASSATSACDPNGSAKVAADS